MRDDVARIAGNYGLLVTPGAPVSQGIVQPVVMSPALLVGLDRRRHSRFIQNWSRLITDTGISLIPPTAP